MILPINKYNDSTQLKILKTPCSRNNINDAITFAADLLETAKSHSNCAGLASNQLWATAEQPAPHVFVAYVRGGWKVFIHANSQRSGKRIPFEEGCMSKPGYTKKIIRREILTISYYDIKGEYKKEVYRGIEAIVLQHELDHMNGTLI